MSHRIFIFALIALSGCQMASSNKAESLRIVTYNVGAFSKYMDNSTPLIGTILKELDPGVVGLNELDSINTRHLSNQIKDLADLMGEWNWHFGRAMAYRDGAYGNGIITPHKILKAYTITLDKGPGAEQRSLAVIETDSFIFGEAHLDHTSDEAQALQVSIINDWARNLSSEKPIFFAGDMNAHLDSKTLSMILESWDQLSGSGNTFISSDPTICIDYIFHYKDSKAVNVSESKVITELQDGDIKMASDHLPVYVEVSW